MGLFIHLLWPDQTYTVWGTHFPSCQLRSVKMDLSKEKPWESYEQAPQKLWLTEATHKLWQTTFYQIYIKFTERKFLAITWEGSITTYTLSVLLWLLSQSDPIPLARLWLPEQQLSICSFIFAWMLQRVMKQKMNGHSWGCAKCNWHGHIIFEKQKLNRGPAMKKQGLTPIECSESVVFVCKESVVCKVANSKQVSSGN